MSLKRKLSPPSQPSLSETAARVFRSDPIEDRASIFVAHFSPTLPAKTLQKSPDFADASHRIAAWRKLSTQRSINPKSEIFECGYDDDGESYAGKRLDKLLEDMKVEGAVVVARWYGGVLLGPVRFTHIERCARQAIMQSRRQLSQTGAANEVVQKRAKLDEEGLDRTRLEQVLAARDQSIIVLRALLAEKSSPRTAPSSSPSKPVNYSAMPVTALSRLEKARDATIAWLLREIDKAEAKTKVFPEGFARESIETTCETSEAITADAQSATEDAKR